MMIQLFNCSTSMVPAVVLLNLSSRFLRHILRIILCISICKLLSTIVYMEIMKFVVLINIIYYDSKNLYSLLSGL